jgi:very-short-patch-repair endonuclease
VSGAVRAWCDCAALVAAVPGTRQVRPDLADLVAAGDALAARRTTTLRDISLVLGTRAGGRGARVARQASRLLDARAESPPESRLLAVEYDGDHHRERRQWRRDLARRERLEAQGWRVVVITAADLLSNPAAVVARVRAALTASRRPS